MISPCPISHNWPQEDFSIQIYSGISLIKRTAPHKGGNGGGIRNVVKNFTAPSRKRLLQKMAACRNMDDGYFCTFTYPGLFLYSWQDCKAHIAALRKRILRKFPQARAIWRMEVKPRLSGASEGQPVPHYHLLLFGLPYGNEESLQETLGDMWNEIANNQRQEWDVLRSDVQQIRSRKHAVYYASKYAAKLDDRFDEGFGRHWGFFGQWDETMSSSHILTGAEMVQLKRLIRGWLKSKNRRHVAKMFSRIRQDFGIAVFGLGDHDDMTYRLCTMVDLIICAQRQVQS